MFALTNKPEMGARLYAGLVALATDAERGTDIKEFRSHRFRRAGYHQIRRQD